MLDVTINTLTTVDSLIPVVDDIITQYCVDNDVDIKNIYPSIWNDIITEIYYTLFNNTLFLKYQYNISNTYDQDKVLEVYEKIYKRICNKHCQQISLKGFCDMTGIGIQTIYDWENAPSCKASSLHKMLTSDNEQSLESLMHDRRNNPMKFLPSLNRKHNWNMPGSRTDSGGASRISLADLKKLDVLIEQKDN